MTCEAVSPKTATVLGPRQQLRLEQNQEPLMSNAARLSRYFTLKPEKKSFVARLKSADELFRGPLSSITFHETAKA